MGTGSHLIPEGKTVHSINVADQYFFDDNGPPVPVILKQEARFLNIRNETGVSSIIQFMTEIRLSTAAAVIQKQSKHTAMVVRIFKMCISSASLKVDFQAKQPVANIA